MTLKTHIASLVQEKAEVNGIKTSLQKELDNLKEFVDSQREVFIQKQQKLIANIQELKLKDDGLNRILSDFLKNSAIHLESDVRDPCSLQKRLSTSLIEVSGEIVPAHAG